MGKVMGPGKFPLKFWKCLGDVSVRWLTDLFNKILRIRKILSKWKRCSLVHIYKNRRHSKLYKLLWN